jgi:hypothetical protein
MNLKAFPVVYHSVHLVADDAIFCINKTLRFLKWNSMNPEKYDRNIRLLCPTCGCSDFSYSQGSGETIQIMVCASCERELNKDELIHENGENVDEILCEVKTAVAKDIASS